MSKYLEQRPFVRSAIGLEETQRLNLKSTHPVSSRASNCHPSLEGMTGWEIFNDQGEMNKEYRTPNIQFRNVQNNDHSFEAPTALKKLWGWIWRFALVRSGSSELDSEITRPNLGEARRCLWGSSKPCPFVPFVARQKEKKTPSSFLMQQKRSKNCLKLQGDFFRFDQNLKNRKWSGAACDFPIICKSILCLFTISNVQRLKLVHRSERTSAWPLLSLEKLHPNIQHHGNNQYSIFNFEMSRTTTIRSKRQRPWRNSKVEFEDSH